jgi:hypothetical protein
MFTNAEPDKREQIARKTIQYMKTKMLRKGVSSTERPQNSPLPGTKCTNSKANP